MARKRNIAPGFFKNEDLGECSALARLFFAGLWCWADREGRLEDRPRKWRAEILPYDRDADGEALVAELERHGFVARYEAAGVKVLEVLEFRKHQDPHPKEAASTLPARDGSFQESPKVDPGSTQGEPGVDPGAIQGSPGEGSSPARPSSPSRPSRSLKQQQDEPRAAPQPPPTRLPTREERLAARWPLASHLAASCAEAWGLPVSLPKTDTDRALVEEAARKLGNEPALRVCRDDVDDAIDGGRLEGPPESLGWCVKALQRAMSAPPAPPKRGPRENPRPEDPDFNDQDAWHDYNAWLARDAGAGGARG